MKVLITGVTGLVGGEIVNLCRTNNIAVNYLSTSKKKIVSDGDYNGFYWNPDKNDIDLKCFEGVTAIINLAGASISKRWTTRYKTKVLASRVNSLRTLRLAMEKIDSSKITSFVSASAIGIYPSSFTNHFLEDEVKVDDSFLGKVVQVWEKEVDTFKKFDLNVAKIRIGLVLSTNGGALLEMAKPIKKYVGASFGSGEQWQSWIHITDLSRIFMFTVENNLQGVYNGVASNPVTNYKLIREIAHVLKKPLFLPNIPKFLMKFILGEMSYLLFASQRVSNKKIEEMGFVFDYPNVLMALENLFTKKNSNNTSEEAYHKKFI